MREVCLDARSHQSTTGRPPSPTASGSVAVRCDRQGRAYVPVYAYRVAFVIARIGCLFRGARKNDKLRLWSAIPESRRNSVHQGHSETRTSCKSSRVTRLILQQYMVSCPRRVGCPIPSSSVSVPYPSAPGHSYADIMAKHRLQGSKSCNYQQSNLRSQSGFSENDITLRQLAKVILFTLFLSKHETACSRLSA
jgi:hypothetical protein